MVEKRSVTEIGDPKIDDPESLPLGTKIIDWELGGVTRAE